MHKKLFPLFLVLISSSIIIGLHSARSPVAVDRLSLTHIPVRTIVKPSSVTHLQDIVARTNGPISVVGARYSQGGQTAYPGGTVIDMSQLSQVVSLDIVGRRITVQAGATWRQVQEAIDPYNLSVKVMQSYNDFSVGGSLSVNVHARDISCGSIGETVESLTLLLADGSLETVTPESELFPAVIGGYGLMGIIIDATLSLTKNVPLRRSVTEVSADDYWYLFKKLKKDTSVVFQNADIYPMDFNKASSITWRETNEPLTTCDRLQERSLLDVPRRAVEKVIQRAPKLNKLRPGLDSFKKLANPVVCRNYEMSYQVNQLAIQSHYPTTMTLQEYFVPVKRYREGLAALRNVLRKYGVNVLNLSIRFVPADTSSILSYACEDSFAFVMYMCIPNSTRGKKKLAVWTEKLISQILDLGGSFYLPYLICATKEQFDRAYPRFAELLVLKKKYDPAAKFRNMLYTAYVDESLI